MRCILLNHVIKSQCYSQFYVVYVLMFALCDLYLSKHKEITCLTALCEVLISSTNYLDIFILCKYDIMDIAFDI